MFQLFGNALSQVLVVSVLVGAGLPALYAYGIRAMAQGAGGDAEVGHEPPRPAMKVVGYLCFALVVAVIAMPIAIIVSHGFGYQVSFDNVLPTFVKKH